MFSVITACLYFITRAWPLSHVLGHHHMYIINFYTYTHGGKINGAICGSLPMQRYYIYGTLLYLCTRVWLLTGRVGVLFTLEYVV